MVDRPDAPAPPDPDGELARWLELLDADPAELSSDDRRDGLRALTRLSTRVDACQSRFLGELDTNGDHVLDGARSPSAWMAATTGVDKRRCGRLLAIDRDLRQLPLVRAAWRSGELTTDKVNALLGVRADVEAQLERDQAALIAAIAGATADGARRRLHRWRESALAELDRSPEDPEPDDPRLNELRITGSFDGQQVLDGTFSPIVGKELAGLIAGEIDRAFQLGHHRADDGLTVGQRNAEALLRLVRRGSLNLTEGGEPKRGVNLVVDVNRLLGISADTIEELLSWPCETADGTRVPLAQVLDTMGDATINTVLGFYGLDGRFKVAGEITTARHANASQRRQLRVRDQRCAWPGCDAPATWCQAHHEPPWDRTHRTTTAELVLLCRLHHTIRHRDGYSFTLGADGDLTVIRPDGTVLPRPAVDDLLRPDGDADDGDSDAGADLVRSAASVDGERAPPGRTRRYRDLVSCRQREAERVDRELDERIDRRMAELIQLGVDHRRGRDRARLPGGLDPPDAAVG